MKNILVICDPDKLYCGRLGVFLENALSIPFDIFGFSDISALRDFKEREEALLIISESLFDEKLIKGFKNILVLDEGDGKLAEDQTVYGDFVNIKRTGKYQSREKLTESVLNMCLEMPHISSGGIRSTAAQTAQLIAFYTPDKITDRNSVSSRFAEEISVKDRLLYICNDPFCIFEGEEIEAFEDNLSDLMYFAECEDERFPLYLEKAAKRKGDIAYIPAAGGQIRDAVADDYLRLIRKIEGTGSYDVILIDIEESFKGLVEFLKICDAVIVLNSQKGDESARIACFRRELEQIDGFSMDKLWVTDMKDSKNLASKYFRMKGETHES